jgi:hypothetical protein
MTWYYCFNTYIHLDYYHFAHLNSPFRVVETFVEKLDEQTEAVVEAVEVAVVAVALGVVVVVVGA